MTIRQTNQFPDVNSLIGANQRQLVRKGDIDVTEAVFRELTHFGGAGISHHTLAFKVNLVQLAGTRGAYRRHAANHAVIFDELHHNLTRQYALRAVGNVHISLFPRLLRESQIRAHFRQPCGHLFCRAHRRGGFEDDQRAFFQYGSNRFRGRFDINHIGVVIALERRRHGDQVRVGCYRRCRGPEESAFNRSFHDAIQIRLNNMDGSTVDGVHRLLIDIHANNVLLARSKGRSRRQPDVSQPNNRNGRKTHSDTRLFFNACKMRPHACPSP